MVTAPDLTATKSDNVSMATTLGNFWTWKITVANAGSSSAAFTTGQTILTDNLPNSNISYGSASVGNIVGTITNSGNISCSITTSNLSCTASGATVTLGAASSFDVTFTATPSATGTFANPRSGGTCAVDPNSVVTESSEANNSCSDSVAVTAPDLTASKSNNVSGATTLGNNWAWTITVANSGTAGAAFTTGQTILSDNLPNSNIAYGSATVGNIVGTITNSGNISCSITTSNLNCTASGATVTIGTASSFDVTFTATPSATGTFGNPRSGGACSVDPGNVVTESSEGNNACKDSVTVTAAVAIVAAAPDAYQLASASNLLAGDSYVNITNAGTRGGYDVSQSGFSPAGGLCANIYIFDPSEEMVACCSCYVSPDGLRSLSSQDLISNTLTPSKPNGIVIKLLASTPAGAGGTTCDPVSLTGTNLAGGLRAWSTSLHQNTTLSSYALTENAFRGAILSTSELQKLTTFCGFIKANGSNFGICKDCRVGGALGGATR